MNDARILDAPWPEDLDPATVLFKGRTDTVLHRHGFYEDWSLFGDLSEATVLSWWNAGPVTVRDLRDTGNTAIEQHHSERDLLVTLKADLEAVASEPWAPHIWYHDPRFSAFLPKGDATVYEIAVSRSTVVRRDLWNCLRSLRGAVEAQVGLSLLDAVSQHVEAISFQSGDRLDILLAQTGLGGTDRITGLRLGVG